MKVVHLNTTDRGGAARASLRLHQGLIESGVESRFVVKHRSSEIPGVTEIQPGTPARQNRLSKYLQNQIRWHRKKKSAAAVAARVLISDCRCDFRPRHFLDLAQADIYQLHWVANFLDWPTTLPWLAERAPIVWRLPDLYACSGTFHYQPDENVLNSTLKSWDQRVRKIKLRALASIDSDRLVVVGPSNWTAERSRRSDILGRFQTQVISNALNTDFFAPIDKREARVALGLEADAAVVGFICEDLMDPRKGVAAAMKSLQNEIEDDVILLSAGSGSGESSGSARSNNVNLGFLKTEYELRLFYSALDVFVMPSLQESFGQTCLEALACATPVVAFKSGGIPDMVRPGVSGCLVTSGDFEALGRTVMEVLERPEELASLSEGSRALAVAEFDSKLQARQYLKLYESLIS